MNGWSEAIGDWGSRGASSARTDYSGESAAAGWSSKIRALSKGLTDWYEEGSSAARCSPTISDLDIVKHGLNDSGQIHKGSCRVRYEMLCHEGKRSKVSSTSEGSNRIRLSSAGIQAGIRCPEAT